MPSCDWPIRALLPPGARIYQGGWTALGLFLHCLRYCHHPSAGESVTSGWSQKIEKISGLWHSEQRSEQRHIDYKAAAKIYWVEIEGRKVYFQERWMGSREVSTCSSRAPALWFGWVFIHYKGEAVRKSLWYLGVVLVIARLIAMWIHSVNPWDRIHIH
jgi:hypothetical protein